MYSYLKNRLKHAIRFRHKRGYGVHSPFVFALILNVIRDKTRRSDYPNEAILGVRLKHRERKLYRLLFRLGGYLDVREVCCVGSRAEVVRQYLSAIDENVKMVEKMSEADFIYIGRDMRDFLPEGEETLHHPVCIVVTDIYKSNSLLWRRLRQQATVSVDMMWYGILFFDEKLQKGHYNLII